MQLGKILDNKILKDQRAQWLLPKARSKNRGLEQKQGTGHTLSTQNHQREGQTHLSHPSSLVSEYTPILTPHKESASPSQGVGKGTYYLFLLTTAAVGPPVKLCPNFLSDLWSISIDGGGQEPWSVIDTIFPFVAARLCLLDSSCVGEVSGLSFRVGDH